MSGAAEELFALIERDGRQNHWYFDCNPNLVQAAEAKAQEMGKRGYFAHCNPDGVCSNSIAEIAGCTLPDFYTPNGNNIESLAAGSPDIEVIFQHLAASTLHANHIFGNHEFFLTQHEIGIGVAFVEGSEFGWYYVVLIAECVP